MRVIRAACAAVLLAVSACGQATDMSGYPAPASYAADSNEQYEHRDANPVRQVAQDPVSTFSIDVDTASYSNVRRFLREGQMPPQDAVRIEELVNYFDYDYPLPQTRETPFATMVSVAPSPWNEGREIVHIGLQGYDIARAERPPLNLVFLIDVSGSMDEPNKLPLVVQSLRMLLDQLRDRDRVSIVVYAGAAGAVLEPTSGADRNTIIEALNNLKAGGSTAGGEGIALAYKLAERNLSRDSVNRVILATDGDFNVGITDPTELQSVIEHERDTGIYLSVLGFGEGNYNDALMQRLAQNGNGVAAYIDSPDEARRVLIDHANGALFPIANDVKVQVEFNPRRVSEYRLIGYETRALHREDFNDDQVDAGEVGAGHAVTAIYEITPVGGSSAANVDPLRYQDEKATGGSPSGEDLAFLRIRYKLPGQNASRLIERPITDRDLSPSLDRAPEQTRWAAAVAGYGQLLRGDPYVQGNFGWRDVIDLAETARGRDRDGWRSEFIDLARMAASRQRFEPFKS